MNDNNIDFEDNMPELVSDNEENVIAGPRTIWIREEPDDTGNIDISSTLNAILARQPPGVWNFRTITGTGAGGKSFAVQTD